MINDTIQQELKQIVRGILSLLPQNIVSKNMNNSDIIQNNHISYFVGDISKEEVSISLMKGL